MNNKCEKIDLVNIEDIKINEKNPNIHSDKQIEILTKIIKHQGFRRPLTISKRSNKLIVGHARLQVAKILNYEKVPVIYQDYENEEQEYLDMVADNSIQNYSVLDIELIKETLIELPDMDLELMALEELNIEPEQLETVNDDEVPEKVIPKTVKGDIYELGQHRLMCGDSTMIDDVEKLIDGQSIELVYTDPPYGINEKGDRTARKTGLARNHNLKDFKDDTVQYAVDAYNLCEALKIPRQIWWGANYYCHSLPQSNNWMVWDKRVEDKMKDTQSDCEMAWVKSQWSSIRIFRHLWKGFNKDSERNQKRVHPTQKPVALAEWCFDYYKAEFKSVLDLFLGSGSTLIACEKTDRKCYGMELDEHYCDVIVQRYVDYCKANKIEWNVKRNSEDITNEYEKGE